jgi:hypothetical protein
MLSHDACHPPREAADARERLREGAPTLWAAEQPAPTSPIHISRLTDTWITTHLCDVRHQVMHQCLSVQTLSLAHACQLRHGP